MNKILLDKARWLSKMWQGIADGKELQIYFRKEGWQKADLNLLNISCEKHSFRLFDKKSGKVSTTICPHCGSTAVVPMPSMNLKMCGDCYKDFPWTLDPGQKPVF